MIRIHDNFDLTDMTTFHLPVKCSRFIEYNRLTDLKELNSRGLLDGSIHIGGGSNLLFLEPEYEGTVIHCTDITANIFEAPEGCGYREFVVAAGCRLDDICRLSCEMGLWGLENLSGIPGEIGGAAVQNVGAYGVEFKDVVDEVLYFSPVDNDFFRCETAACEYGYRSSIFKSCPGMIVCAVKLRLRIAPSPILSYKALADRFGSADPSELTPQMLRDEVIALRDSKLPDPAKTGSAGSFFKNPVVSAARFAELQQRLGGKFGDIPGHQGADGSVKLSAAWLIDKAGCKDMTEGGASLWPSQPLVIVNTSGTASGRDVLRLENAIVKRVDEQFGISLQPEVVHIS